MRGRERELKEIIETLKALQVCRLLQGKIDNWEEFAGIEGRDWASLPRPHLKQILYHSKKKWLDEIREFCIKECSGATEETLVKLYDAVKAQRRVVGTLDEFVREYPGVIEKEAVYHPIHATVAVGIHGKGFLYPESFLSRDVCTAFRWGMLRGTQVSALRKKRFSKGNRAKMTYLRYEVQAAARMCVSSCFSLMEAYVNGVAWDLFQDGDRVSRLSAEDEELLADRYHRVSLLRKLKEYPYIIVGKPLSSDEKSFIYSYVKYLKLFRNALMHPSPFTAPEKSGEDDKLAILYNLDWAQAIWTIYITYLIIWFVHHHIKGNDAPDPRWLEDMRILMDEHNEEEGLWSDFKRLRDVYSKEELLAELGTRYIQDSSKLRPSTKHRPRAALRELK